MKVEYSRAGIEKEVLEHKNKSGTVVPAMESNEATLSRHTVLVVEDDPASRQYLKLLLNYKDYDVVLADNGEDALLQMKAACVDSMLLDIALGPGITGLDLGEELKQDSRFSETPMIAVTAYAEESLGNLFEKGFTGYLQKPYMPKELWKVLAIQLKVPEPSER